MYNDIRLKLSPPWVTYLNELTEMFKHDSEISVRYDNVMPAIYLDVTNPEKAAALSYLLPDITNFGNVDVFLFIEGEMSDRAFPDKTELFDILFEKNPIYSFSYTVHDVFTNPIVYVVFKNRVVQFFNDNLNDIYGNVSTLYEDIANDIFSQKEQLSGVCFCTDVEEKIGMPLGEWP